MNTSKLAVDAIGVIFELYIVYLYFGVIFGKPCVPKRWLVAFYVFCASVNILVPVLFGNIPTEVAVIINVSTYIFLSFPYRGTTVVRFFSSVLFYVFFVAFDIISGVILSNIFSVDVASSQTNTGFYLQGVLLSRFEVFVLVKIIGMNKKAKTAHASFKASVLLTLFALASILATCTIASVAFGSLGDKTALFSTVSIAALVLSNVFIFHLFDEQCQIEQTKERLKFIQDQLQRQVEHYKELYNVQQETHKIWHDMKNSLMAVSGYLSNHETSRAIAYIEDLSGKVSKAIHVVDTGCPAVDAILKAKIQKAENEGAALQYNIVLPEKLAVDALDLAILIANGLDNAVEAVSNMQEVSKTVSLKILPKQDYIFIMIRNPVKREVNVTDLKTTKSDKMNHGFGLENIRTIAKKYEGDVNIQCSNQVFTLSVVLQNK